MATYRVLELNQSGVVDRAQDLRFDSDAAARDYAVALASPGVVEVWLGGRQVAHLPPTRAPRPPASRPPTA